MRFDQYGDIDVLNVVDVERPVPGRGQVLVRVKAAGINPGEASIREGLLHERWPATFPSGEGTDLAGVVEEVGPGVDGLEVDAEVIGLTEERASHAELVVVPADQLTPKPESVSWDAAGALFVAGTTAYAAVRAVGASAGRHGRGLRRRRRRRVARPCSSSCSPARPRSGSPARATTSGCSSTARFPSPTATASPVGSARSPTVTSTRSSTRSARATSRSRSTSSGSRPIASTRSSTGTRAQKYGVKMEGTAAASSAGVLAELAALVDEGRLEVPIAKVYPLDDVRDAFRELEQRHTRGKIVLVP